MKSYTVEEKENSTEVKIIIAGVDKQDIDISLVDDGYTEESNTMEYSYLGARQNCIISTYPYTIIVNCEKAELKYEIGSDSNKNISASLDKGILKIVIPKKQRNKQKIQIN